MEITSTYPELRRYGYAPGSYMFKCLQCNRIDYDGDKRATCCLACAKNLEAGRLQKERSAIEATGRSMKYTPLITRRINRFRTDA